MADEDKSIKLNIELEKTGTGGSSAAADLNSVKAAAGEAGSQVEDLSKKVHEGSEHLHLFAGQGREMHHVISELNRISPVLGEALRVAMHPVGGTVAAAIGLFVLMKEYLHEINKELDEMGAKAAEPEFLEGIRAKQQVLTEAAAAAAEYFAHLDQIGNGEANVTAQLTAQLALQKSINEARAAQAASEEALAQARIKALVATGKLTPAEGEAAGEQAKRDAIKAAAQAKADADQQELTTKTKALESLDVPGDQANAKALMETYDRENARREQNKKDAEAAARGEADAQKRVEEITRQLEADPDYIGAQKYKQKVAADLARGDTYHAGIDRETGSQFERGLNAPNLLGGPTGQELINLREQFQSQANSFGQIKSKASADEKTEADFIALKIAMEDAKKKAEESTAAQKKLTDEVKALHDVIAGSRGANAATTRAKVDETFYSETDKFAGDIHATGQASQKLGAGKLSVSEGQAALLEAQGATRALVSTVKEATKEHSGAVKMLLDELAAQRSETAQLAAQLRAMRSTGTGG